MLLGLLAILLNACSSSYQAGPVRNPSRANGRTPEKITKSGPSNVLADEVVAYAKRYVGVPYRYGGKNPKGFDCSGFTGYVYKKFDVNLSASSKMQAKQGRSIKVSSVQKGDLLFFGKGRKMTHVALVTEHTRAGIEVIHSTSSRGVMVQNVSKSDYWRPRILFARRVLD